ncbi:MAG: NADH:flavin oxidoreductase [Anaerolineae bacterium]|jgi:2,4-dienoyl-CoA reductase-like NADH-dependent reductase (Old Yellow Enzyme family)
MSILFEPIQLGQLEIKNRFVRSATFESMATERGEVTEDLVRLYRTLAKGDIGLIIPGYMFVHGLGKGSKYQIGIHDDAMIAGLRMLTNAVHQEGGRVVFQLMHAGRQTKKSTTGHTPLAPSAHGRDPTFFVKPAAMSEAQIETVIQAFGQAARRAVEAGADGVEVHAAHGYLLNQFLSPFWNRREDGWGGSDEKRFRLLKETVLAVRKALPAGMPLLVKLSTYDGTGPEGVTPELALTYARWLAELGIDGLELSSGSTYYSFADMTRGDIPVDELALSFSRWMRPLARLALRQMSGKFDLEEGYNLPASRVIKPEVGEIPVMVVGGLRRVAQMEAVLEEGAADMVSMARPFVREPYLVRRIREGRANAAACTSCNKCFALIATDQPLRCAQLGAAA